jgi:hypothetical protein
MALRGREKSSMMSSAKLGSNYLCVQPNGEMDLSYIDKGKLCADACSKKEFCEILTRRLSLRDLCVDADGPISALTLFDTEIRSDVKLLALFKPEFNLGLRPNPWAKAVLPSVLKANDKLVIFGPVLVVVQHNIQYQQSLLELKQEGMIEILAKRGLPQPLQAAATAGISKRVHIPHGMNGNGHDGPQLATDTDLDLNTNAVGDIIRIQSRETLITAINKAESYLTVNQKCTTAEDEERYLVTSDSGNVQDRPKVRPCTFFRLDEPCQNLRPASRRTWSGKTQSCTYSHHPSTFQFVPRWCLDDIGFICWSLKFLQPERKLVQEILKRLISIYDQSMECPICFHKQILMSWHADGTSQQQNHSACCSCMLEILEKEANGACPQCRVPFSAMEARTLKEQAEANLPKYKAFYEIAVALRGQLPAHNGYDNSKKVPSPKPKASQKSAYPDSAFLHSQCADAWSNHDESDSSPEESSENPPLGRRDSNDDKDDCKSPFSNMVQMIDDTLRDDDRDLVDPDLSQERSNESTEANESTSNSERYNPPHGFKQGLETPGTTASVGSDIPGFETSITSAMSDARSACGDYADIGANPRDMGHEYSLFSSQEPVIVDGIKSLPFGPDCLQSQDFNTRNDFSMTVDTADGDEIENHHGIHLPSLPSSPPPPPPPPTPPQPSPHSANSTRPSMPSAKRPPPPMRPPLLGAPGTTPGENSGRATRTHMEAPIGSPVASSQQEHTGYHSVDDNKEQARLEVQQWLFDHNLSQYEDNLRDVGGDRLDFVQFLQEPDLEGTGIPVLHKRAMVVWASEIGNWRATRAHRES